MKLANDQKNDNAKWKVQKSKLKLTELTKFLPQPFFIGCFVWREEMEYQFN